MQKPITVARQEFIDTVANAINNSGLPAFLISDALKEFLSQLEPLEEKQFQRDFAEWEKFVSEQEHEEKGE